MTKGDPEPGLAKAEVEADVLSGAGLHELEAAGFSGIIMDAVEAATERSKELGK